MKAKDTQPKLKPQRNLADTFLAYVALFALAGGTLRAVMLESGNEQVTVIMGFMLVLFALSNIVKQFGR